MWVGLPYILGEQAIPPVVGFYVKNMQDEFKSMGVAPKKYFYGGHSLGAAAISAWGHANPETVEGVFVEGGYAPLAIEDPAANYGAPFLTLGAEFDGWMARITRMAEAHDEMTSSSIGYDKSKYSYPVVVLPGLGHASFLSGTPPPTVQKTDLRATVSEAQAIEQISNVVSAFFTVTVEGKTSAAGSAAAKTIDHYIDEVSLPMIQPILDMYAYEGNTFMSSFKNSTPIVAESQKFVAKDALKQNAELHFDDEYKTFTAISGEFSHAKPTISSDKTSGFDVQSFSHAFYDIRTTPKIDAANYYAAHDIGAKFKSREAIYKYFNMSWEGPQEEATCQDINKRTAQWVMDNWQDTTGAKERFQKHGQPLEYVEDTSSGSGITWCNEGAVYTNTTESMKVSARALLSPVDFFVPVAAGMLYCKIMSPARILEWMLVDGLK